MANFQIIMPKLGESIIEATITKWLKSPGDTIEEDDAIVEIATDKVDSEIPSPVEGTLKEVLFQEGDVVEVGKVIAIIEIEGEDLATADVPAVVEQAHKEEVKIEEKAPAPAVIDKNVEATRFYSPLVKNIAKTEGVSMAEMESIAGSGKEGRVTKQDILDFLKNKPAGGTAVPKAASHTPAAAAPAVVSAKGDEIVEMGRMRKLIADHMVMSKQVSPHVTSFIEVNMANVVIWRNKMKEVILKRDGEKLTFTPILIEATAQAIKDYPRINASVDGTNIIIRKNINIGMAAALP